MTIAWRFGRMGIDQRKTWRNELHGGAEEEPMRLVTLVAATALGLASVATAHLHHDQSEPPQRYGSWQELSAAQPSCRSMTNLSKRYPAGAGGLQCSVPGVACA